MSANAVRLIVSAGAGIGAAHWLGLGVPGFCAAVAAGFALYAALSCTRSFGSGTRIVRCNHRGRALLCVRPGDAVAATSAEDKAMRRAFIPALTAVPLILIGTTESWVQPICRPTLAFTEAHYAPMKLPKLERTWTVALTVDASPCAAQSGTFSILFTVWKENAPDIAFVETFQWTPDLNVISKEFWVDEAVGAYRVHELDQTPGRRSRADRSVNPHWRDWHTRCSLTRYISRAGGVTGGDPMSSSAHEQTRRRLDGGVRAGASPMRRAAAAQLQKFSLEVPVGVRRA